MMRRIWDYWPYYRSFGLKGREIAQTLFPLHSGSVGSEQSVTIPGLPFPILFRPGTMDTSVFNEIFVQKLYSKRLPFVPHRIIDAGAHVGYASLYFQLHYPDAQIVALEAEEANFQLLQKNVGHYPNIRPLHAALWHHQALVTATNQAATNSSFSFSEVVRGPGISAVSPGEILNMMKWDEIDLFKINIEGGEKTLFSNQPLDWVKLVHVFMMDLHDRFLPGCTEAVTKILQPLGFRYTRNQDIHFFIGPKASRHRF
jgi:FkbM family methyltransferase